MAPAVPSRKTGIPSFSKCPVPEVERKGDTVKKWHTAVLTYFTTNGRNQVIYDSTEVFYVAKPLKKREKRRLRELLTYRGLNR